MITFMPKPKALAQSFSVILLFLLIFTFIVAYQAHAASLSVSLSVGLTYFQADGYTSPLALVKLTENNTVIATTTSDSTGHFSLSTLGEDGIHTYSLYATDQDGELTGTYTTTVSLTSGTTTTESNLVLPPTFAYNNLDLEIGEDLVISGMGVPSSTVTLIYDSSSHTSVNTDSSGRWSLRLSTDNLSSGTHSLALQNSLPSGYFSGSTTQYLTLRPRSPTNISLPPIASSPSPSPTLFPLPWWLTHFDFDGDGHLALSDLSRIASYWLKQWLTFLKTGSGTCDLNQDGVCNLIDFSILLYHVDR